MLSSAHESEKQFSLMEQRLNAVCKQTSTVKTQIRKHRLKDNRKEEAETSTSNHSQAAVSGLILQVTIDRDDQKLGVANKQSPYFAEMNREE